MKQSISPMVGWIIIVVVVIVVGLLIWHFTSHPLGSASSSSINQTIQAGVAKPGSAPSIPTGGASQGAHP